MLPLGSCEGISQHPQAVQTANAGSNVNVVELFTSEGCSSCPPADKLLRTIQSENAEVYVLSYHVDYWDRLGWKDPFSQHVFTERQQSYAQQFQLESVYTPQVVINGSSEFVGSNEPKLRSALKQSSQVTTLEVNLERKKATALALSFDLQTDLAGVVYVALVRPAATTVVKRGENGGRTLQHVNVVRQLTSLDAKTGAQSLDINIPTELQSEKLRAIVFVQQKADKHIKAAAMIDIPSFQSGETK